MMHQKRKKWTISKTILYLDDHRLFTKAIKQLVAAKMEVNYLSYQSPEVAFEDIQKRLANKIPIDLIITDYNHPGITVQVMSLHVK